MTIEHKTDLIESHQTDCYMENFGLQDKKGRYLGVRVTLGVREYKTIKAGAKSWYQHAPGMHYVAQVYPTRDGSEFGSWQSFQHFGSEDERSAWVAKRIKETAARYRLKVAKGAV